MSAHSVVGTSHDVAEKLNKFWEALSPEQQAALHTAFNLKKCQWRVTKEVGEILANAESGRHSISDVTNSFFNFMVANIGRCPDARSMMEAILADDL